MKKNIITMSLWGDSKFYCQGAIENILLAPKIYPGWTFRLYIAEDCPALNDIQKLGVETVVMPPTKGVTRDEDGWVNKKELASMMWRLLVLSEDNVERIIVRDTDSRLNVREKAAVDQWIESGATAHRMHEVKEHWNAPVMLGMFGIKGGLVTDIKTMMDGLITVDPHT